MKRQIAEAGWQRSTDPTKKRAVPHGTCIKDGKSKPQLKKEWIDSADRKDLTAILNNLPHGFVVLGSVLGQALYVNRKIPITLGYSPSDTPTSKDLLEKIFPEPDVRNDVIKEWKQIAQSGGGVCTLNQVLCKDGTIRAFEIRVTVLRKDLIVSMWTDVTQRYEAETRLRESENRWRGYFEDSPDPLLLFDGDRVINCNLAAQKMFNCRNTETIIGLTINDLLSDKPSDSDLSREKVRDLFKSVMERGHNRSEWTARRRDGTTTPVELSMAVIAQDGKRLVSVTLRDISRWREAEDILLHAKTDLENMVEARTAELLEANTNLRKSREELRQFSEYLQRAREEERTRIAREVHDELGQLLTGLKMELQYQAQHFPRSKRLFSEQTEAILRQIDDATKTVKELCADLRPAMLTHFGLLPTIEWYLQTFEKRSGIRSLLKVYSRIPILKEDLGLVIFRIIQEATANVLRHSGATEMSVSVRKKSGYLVLVIADNGRGISDEEINNPHSFGIIGIRERVHSWGGQSHLEGIPDNGTVLTVSIPLDSARRNRRAAFTKALNMGSHD
jgi:PAS domain S-box-containing protein